MEAPRLVRREAAAAREAVEPMPPRGRKHQRRRRQDESLSPDGAADAEAQRLRSLAQSSSLPVLGATQRRRDAYTPDRGNDASERPEDAADAAPRVSARKSRSPERRRREPRDASSSPSGASGDDGPRRRPSRSRTSRSAGPPPALAEGAEDSGAPAPTPVHHVFPREAFYEAWSFEAKPLLDLRRWVQHVDLAKVVADCAAATCGATNGLKLGGGGHADADSSGDAAARAVAAAFRAAAPARGPAPHGWSLTKLDVADCSNLTDAGFKTLAAACPALTWLDVSRCGHLTDRAFQVLANAESAPKLKALFAADLPRLSDLGGIAVCKATNLATADFARCSRLSAMFFDHFGSAAMERCVLDGMPKMTNQALGAFLRRCAAGADDGPPPKLTALSLRDAAALTDGAAKLLTHAEGLQGWKRHGALAQLNTFSLSGNAKVTDAFVQALSAASHKGLKALTLVDCPHVGADAALFGDVGARHGRTLRDVDFSGSGLTDDALLSYCEQFQRAQKGKAIGLRRLDVSRCHVGERGLTAVALLASKRLVGLRVSDAPAVTDNAVLQVAMHCTSLQTLELRGLKQVSDQALAVVVRRCRKLEGADFSNMPAVTLRVVDELRLLRLLCTLDLSGCDGMDDEALERLPQKLTTLRIAKLPLLTDAGVEAVARQCPRLKAIDLRMCPKLTERAVEAMLRLGRAQTIDGRNTSRVHRVELTGCPLMDKNRLRTVVAQHACYLRVVTQGALGESADKFENEEMLSDFCGLVDHSQTSRAFFGGQDGQSSGAVSPDAAPTGSLPLLQIRRTPETLDELARDGAWADRVQAKKSATMYQKRYRTMMLERLAYAKRMARLDDEGAAATALCALARGCLARKRLKRIERVRQSAGTICRLFRLRRDAARAVAEVARLRKQYQLIQLRTFVNAWRAVPRTRPWTIAEGSENVEKARKFFRAKCQSKHLMALAMHVFDPSRAKNAREAGQMREAVAFWAQKRLPRIWSSWSQQAQAALERKRALVVVFYNVCAVDSYNSARSRDALVSAKAAWRQRLLQRYFKPLRDWARTNSPHSRRLAEARVLLGRMAFDRDAPRVFAAFKLYRDFGVAKRAAKSTAEIRAPVGAQRHLLHRLRRFAVERAISYAAAQQARASDWRKKGSQGLCAFARQRSRRHFFKKAQAQGEAHSKLHQEHLMGRWAFPTLLRFALTRRHLKQAFHQVRLRQTAQRMRDAMGLLRLTWMAARAFKCAADAQLEARLCVSGMLVELATVTSTWARIQCEATNTKAQLALHNFDADVARRKASALGRTVKRRVEKRDLALEEWDRGDDDRALDAAVATLLQRVWRGKMGRDEARDYRIERDFSVLLAQRNVRRWFAARRLHALKRHRRLRVYLGEERENELMYLEELRQRVAMAEVARWAPVQNLVRGYLAWKRTRAMVHAVVRSRAQRRGLDRKAALALAKGRDKARRARSLLEEDTAVRIQAWARGFNGKRHFSTKLQFKLESYATLRLQTEWRRTLARRSADAKRRAVAQRAYLDENRKRQGAVLRAVLRRMQRRTQRAYLKLAIDFGVDPMSYTISVTAQCRELREDARQMLADARFEWKCLRKGGLDSSKRGLARDALLKDVKARAELRQGDAVRVVDAHSAYRGLTAFLAAVDKTIPGAEIAELTFDRTGETVSMPLISEGDKFSAPRRALCRIEALQRPAIDSVKVVGNKDALLKWARLQRGRLAAYAAAVKIQSLARRVQARRRVGRRRYAYWKGSKARRVVLLKWLTAVAALHQHGASTLLQLRLGLRMEDLRGDLPGWETEAMASRGAPPALIKERRRQRQQYSKSRELGKLHALRRQRVQQLRRGATPNNAVRLMLFNKVAKLSAIASVREDRGADLRRWRKFNAAAPYARRTSLSLAVAAPVVSSNLLSPLARIAIALRLVNVAWYLRGADALLDVGLRRSSAAEKEGHLPKKLVDDPRTKLVPELDATYDLPSESVAARFEAQNVWAAHVDISAQFGESPHLRVRDVALYHGCWGGHPVKRLRQRAFYPEGEGLLEFLDGYGCAAEEKTLRVRVVRCRGIVVDSEKHPDPFVKVECNLRSFQTRVLRDDSSPNFDETFELDVTDPAELLRVSVFDWDKYSSPDFIGQVVVQLGALPDDELPVKAWYWLGDYRPYHAVIRRTLPFKREQIHDRGEVELELTWNTKPTAEDLDLRRRRRGASLKISSWARGRLALLRRRGEDSQRNEARRVISNSSVLIQKVSRSLAGRRIARKVRARRSSATRLQAFFRRKISWNALQLKRLEFFTALRLQLAIRRYCVQTTRWTRIMLRRWIEEAFAVVALGCFARCCIARRRSKKRRAARKKLNTAAHLAKVRANLDVLRNRRDSEDLGVNLDALRRRRSSILSRAVLRDFRMGWLAWYGRDKEFGTIRLRRIALRAARKLMATEGARVRTSYGPAEVAMTPAPRLAPTIAPFQGTMVVVTSTAVEAADELRQPAHGYALMRLLGCREPYDVRPSLSKDERRGMLVEAPRFLMTIRLGSVLVKLTVLDRVRVLQCMFRFWAAVRRVRRLLQRHAAAANVQRMARAWLWRRRCAAEVMQAVARVVLAKAEAAWLRHEVESARRLQSLYRVRIARRALDSQRAVSNVEALLSSSEAGHLYTAANTLDDRHFSYWCTAPGETKDQWVVYDLGATVCIGAVEVLCPDSTAAPRLIALDTADGLMGPFKQACRLELPAPQSVKAAAGVLKHKKKPKHDSVKPPPPSATRAVDLRCSVGKRAGKGGKGVWTVVHLPHDVYVVERFWKLRVLQNWSSSASVAVHGVRFLRHREKSAKILSQPGCIFVPHDTVPLGRETPLMTLRVEADAWPRPTYQWTKDGVDLYGETSPTISFKALVRPAVQCRKFRCLHCRKVNAMVPVNAFRNCCVSCKTIFHWPEYEESAVLRGGIFEASAMQDSVEATLRRREDTLNEDIFAVEMRMRMRATPLEAAVVVDEAVVEYKPVAFKKAASQAIVVKSSKRYKKFVPPTSGALTEKPRGKFDFLRSIRLKDIQGSRGLKFRNATLKDLSTSDHLEFLQLELCEVHEALAVVTRAKEDVAFERLRLKPLDAAKLDYACEGVYACVVSNVRGGSVVRSSATRPVAVVVGDPPPLRTKVHEDYVPRPHEKRKRFEAYVSLQGFSRRGMVIGDVVLRYSTGETYLGPLVAERWVDAMGVSQRAGRDADHWGSWVRADSTIIEGVAVDNHFDTRRIHGDFRVTYPRAEGATGEDAPREKFEGQIVDGKRHGIGEYTYTDGSAYKGDWHCGFRQGFGTLIALDGATYVGEWDRGKIHGLGKWSWPDGSSYTGESYDGLRSGTGVYVSSKRDVFVGEFLENNFHGRGLFTYHDGSKFQGMFEQNQRSGLGTFTTVLGVKFVGPYVQNVRNGEFVVRRPVAAPLDVADEFALVPVCGAEAPVWHDEIQTGLWDRGEFVEWLSPPVNPLATMQFVQVFENDEVEFDGVYALSIARRLPKLPHGVQPRHPRVVPIIDRIIREGGHLVARETYADVEAELALLEPELEAKLEEMRLARDEMAEQAEGVAHRAATVSNCTAHISVLAKRQRMLLGTVEKFWNDDPTGCRSKFQSAVESVVALELRDFFRVRYYPEPPALLEKILRACSILLEQPETWKSAQLLLSSSATNADEGDADALVHSYSIKLQYLIGKFDVWRQAADHVLISRLAGILVDPRMKPSHYHVRSHGPAPPAFVTLVKAGHAYLVKSADVRHVKLELDDVSLKLISAARIKDEALREEDEAREAYDAKKRALERKEKLGRYAKRKVDKLRAMAMECQGMMSDYHSDEDEAAEDYYIALDDKAGESARHDVEVCLDELCSSIVDMHARPPPGGEEWLKVHGTAMVMFGGRAAGGTADQRADRAKQAQISKLNYEHEQSRLLADAAIADALLCLPPQSEAFDVLDFARHTARRIRAELLDVLPHYYTGGNLLFGQPDQRKTIVQFRDGTPEGLKSLGFDSKHHHAAGRRRCFGQVRRATRIVWRALERSPLHETLFGEEAGRASEAYYIDADPTVAYERGGIFGTGGRRIDVDFVKSLVQYAWFLEATEAVQIKTCESWLNAFPRAFGEDGKVYDDVQMMPDDAFYTSPEYFAILARVNISMKPEKRCEGKIWAAHRRNRVSVAVAEYRLAEAFEAEHEPTDMGAARACFAIVAGGVEASGPDVYVAATTWKKLNPDKIGDVLLDMAYDLAMDFEEQFSEQQGQGPLSKEEAERVATAAAYVVVGVSPLGFTDAETDPEPLRAAAAAWMENNVQVFAEHQATVGDKLADAFHQMFCPPKVIEIEQDFEDVVSLPSQGAEDAPTEADADQLAAVAMRAIQASRDAMTPARFRAAGRAWAARHRAHFRVCLVEADKIEQRDDEAKMASLRKVGLDLRHRSEVLEAKVQEKRYRDGDADSDLDSQDDETADGTAETPKPDALSTEIDDLTEVVEALKRTVTEDLLWRRRLHGRRLKEWADALQAAKTDKSYLVCLRNLRPSEMAEFVAEKTFAHSLHVERLEADVAAQTARIAALDADVERAKPYEPEALKEYDENAEYGDYDEPYDENAEHYELAAEPYGENAEPYDGTAAEAYDGSPAVYDESAEEAYDGTAAYDETAAEA